MLVGEYQHTVDTKGRIVLPSKFRDAFADGCVVTKGQEHCLFVFPLDRWAEEEARVNALPRTDQRARRFARTFFASADSQVPDKQGRIAVNPKLREFAGIAKDVTVIGVSDRIEIWETEAWETLSTEADNYYSDIEEALSEHGI
ncbi:MAG: division/cell wall cluster transcriptional repressor MraZ [Acidimicrobiia bacterium]|nr:division/cell wall cluster transcriptional repressor MraZ [Acidimicrobiia bacterium]